MEIVCDMCKTNVVKSETTTIRNMPMKKRIQTTSDYYVINCIRCDLDKYVCTTCEYLFLLHADGNDYICSPCTNKIDKNREIATRNDAAYKEKFGIDSREGIILDGRGKMYINLIRGRFKWAFKNK